MKIRLGFVSNSSSASFIVSFKSNKTYEEVKKLILEDSSASHLSKPQMIVDWTESKERGETVYKQISEGPQIDKYLELDGSTYRFKPSTIMFNDWGDIPGWSFIRALIEGKIEGLKPDHLIQDFDGHDECFREVDFKEIGFESENKNSEYISYLNKIGCDINNDDIKKLLS